MFAVHGSLCLFFVLAWTDKGKICWRKTACGRRYVCWSRDKWKRTKRFLGEIIGKSIINSFIAYWIFFSRHRSTLFVLFLRSVIFVPFLQILDTLAQAMAQHNKELFRKANKMAPSFCKGIDYLWTGSFAFKWSHEYRWFVPFWLFFFTVHTGNLHGYYDNLLYIFQRIGKGQFPSDGKKWLFLGNYVDRGPNGIELTCLLLVLKMLFPNKFFLLRGSHEVINSWICCLKIAQCGSISRIYGFYYECRKKYNIKLWKTFITLFDCLPIVAIVNKEIFCVHGGLSPGFHLTFSSC